MCYTSGTTGQPKGAMITHRNLISVTASGIESCLHIHHSDDYLSFLPLPHIFERVVITGLLSAGSAIAFSQGDPLKIIEDVIALQPTIFCAVPRLLTRIHTKIIQKVNSTPGLKSRLFHYALKSKLNELSYKNSHPDIPQSGMDVWDKLIFRPLKTSLGLQRVRKLISGGAPLPGNTMDFFRVMLGPGCSCHEGYGMTETTGIMYRMNMYMCVCNKSLYG